MNADLYGCDTWSLTLREGHFPRVLENRMLRKIFGPEREREREREQGSGEGCIMRSFAPYQSGGQIKVDETRKDEERNGYGYLHDRRFVYVV